MSHKENTPPFQSSEGPSHSRRRLYPDSARNPSMRGIQFNPLSVNPSSSRSPLVPPVPLSQGERHQPILPTGVASSQHSISHLDPWRASSSNPSSKRDFASAFEGVDFGSIFRQSAEWAAVDPQTGWVPRIHSPEDFDYQSLVFILGAKWAYNAVVDNNMRPTQAEDPVSDLRSQIDTILASLEDDRRKAEDQLSVLRTQIATITASLEDVRTKADQLIHYQIRSIQAFLERERRLREQVFLAQQAVAEKVGELEVKMDVVMRELEQKRADVNNTVNVNTRLQPDITDMDHMGNATHLQADMNHMGNANTRLQGDIAGALEHSRGE